MHSRDLLTALRRIIRMIEQHSHATISELGVTGPQLLIIKELAQNQPLSVGRLVDALGVTSATMTGIIDRLVLRGLVTRDRSLVDRRQVLVSLTEPGRALLGSAPLLPQERLAVRCDNLPVKERIQIVDSLNKVVSMMDDSAEANK